MSIEWSGVLTGESQEVHEGSGHERVGDGLMRRRELVELRPAALVWRASPDFSTATRKSPKDEWRFCHGVMSHLSLPWFFPWFFCSWRFLGWIQPLSLTEIMATTQSKGMTTNEQQHDQTLPLNEYHIDCSVFPKSIREPSLSSSFLPTFQEFDGFTSHVHRYGCHLSQLHPLLTTSHTR